MIRIFLSYTKALTIVILIMVNASCSQKRSSKSILTKKDSVEVIQTVLDDQELVRDTKKYFRNEQFKIIANKVVKEDYQLWFAGQAVKVVPEEGDNQEIHLRHPRQLYASIPMLRQVTVDSVQLSMVFHSGNATALFILKNDNEKWKILGRQYGKF